VTFSTIYDQVRLKAKELLADRTELVDPYNPENNTELLLRSGIGLTVTQGTPAPTFTNHSVVTYDFTVVLTDEWLKLDNDAEPLHPVVKRLYEAENTLRATFEAEDQLELADIFNITHINTDGVGFLTTDRTQYATLTVTFSITYSLILQEC